MSDRAKAGLAVTAAAAVAVVVGLVTGGEEPSPMRAEAPTYLVAGVNLSAARGCAEVPGCTADVWAQLPDGGTVRLVVRAGDAGQLQYLDGGESFDLELDGGMVSRP